MKFEPDPAAHVRRDVRGGGAFVETERLILRIYDLGHFPGFLDLSSDPDTFRFSERGPMSCEEAWARLLRHVGHWSALGYGPFAIEDKESGRFAGEAGFCDFRRGLGPQFDGAPEAFWAIAGWARGRGYATEAAAAALDWMEGRFGTERSVCLIHHRNKASLNVAAKLGYGAFGRCRYRGYPALLHERPRPPVQ